MHSRIDIYMLVNSNIGRVRFGQFQTMTDLHVVQSSFSAGKI